MRIDNSDSDENPYEFAIQGTGTVSALPEIDIRGNGVSVVDGDTTPSVGDFTDFGSAGVTGQSVTRVFTILNTGTGALSLTGSPLVTISGAQAGDFSVTVQPSSSVAAGGQTTFQITFDPSASGLRTATVRIDNSDGDENPYEFTIQGTGMVASEVQVVDGGDSGFSVTGTWSESQQGGYGDSAYRSTAGTGTNTATWAFTVAPGEYLVAATWPTSSSTVASKSPYSIYDGDFLLGTVRLNQNASPDDFSEGGTAWELLDYAGCQGVFQVSSGTLVIKMTNYADNDVLADAIRIELIEAYSTPVSTPEGTPAIAVSASGVALQWDAVDRS